MLLLDLMIRSTLIAHLSHIQKVLYDLIPPAPMAILHFFFSFLKGNFHVIKSSLLFFPPLLLQTFIKKCWLKLYISAMKILPFHVTNL